MARVVGKRVDDGIWAIPIIAVSSQMLFNSMAECKKNPGWLSVAIAS
ncbi:hypothetical protein [Alteromonas antoniana]|nr:hypothetical protein [Alteromonas antoniana]